MNSNATSKRRKKDHLFFLWDFYEPKIYLKESKNSLVQILFSIAATLRNKQSSGSLIVFKEAISLSNSLYKFYVSRPIAATLRSGIVFNVVIL